MKLYGTFTCGHEGQIEIFGTKSQREWQEKKAFSKECQECAERSRAKAAEEAAAAAEELGYKPLTGSVKQVAWATTIRKTWIDSIDAITAKWTEDIAWMAELGKLDRSQDDALTLMHDTIDAFMSETDSRHWIDLGNACTDTRVNMEAVADYGQKNRARIERIEKATVTPTSEDIVKPETQTHDGIAKVECTVSSTGKAVLIARYPKDDTFRSIVKEHHLAWDGSCWSRTISLTSAPIEDRAAELANALITAGFAVKLSPEAKDKLVNGTYTAECRRWIISYATTKLVARFDRDYDINSAIKDIGGRWDNVISAYRLDPAKYRSIERFAETYGFRISDGAKKLMDAHRFTMDAATTVAPKPVSNTMEEVMTENGLIGDLIDD